MNPAQQRLARLLEFLAQDPDNPPLMADAFDCALAAHDWPSAQRLADTAREKNIDPPGWQFRSATLAIATRDWARATGLLEALQAEFGDHPAITHNLAWVDFEQEDYAAVAARLGPLIRGGQTDEALCVLHLRALHRLGAFEDAITLAHHLEQLGGLPPAAAGVASLIAVDDDQLPLARRWSEIALAADAEQMEALVARAAVALADTDANAAKKFSERALAHNPNDGRAASSLGFAQMLGMDIQAARQSFERSLENMPEHIGTWLGLGWACLLLQDLPAAQRAFESALALDRNFSETHGALAVLAAFSGRVEDARREIELARGLDSKDVSSMYAAALLSGEASDPERIQRLAKVVLKSRGISFPAGAPGGDVQGKPGSPEE